MTVNNKPLPSPRPHAYMWGAVTRDPLLPKNHPITSGAYVLAEAMLSHHFAGDLPEPSVCEAFMRGVVGGLPDDWTFARDDIHAALSFIEF